MLSAKVEGSFFHKAVLVPLRYGVVSFEVVSFCYIGEEASERRLRSWLHLHLCSMMRRWQRICIATFSNHRGSSSPSTSAISASGTGISLAEIIYAEHSTNCTGVGIHIAIRRRYYMNNQYHLFFPLEFQYNTNFLCIVYRELPVYFQIRP